MVDIGFLPSIPDTDFANLGNFLCRKVTNAEAAEVALAVKFVDFSQRVFVWCVTVRRVEIPQIDLKCA